MRRGRAVLAAALGLLIVDLVVTVVTGSTSILPGLSPVGAGGFTVRVAD